MKNESLSALESKAPALDQSLDDQRLRLFRIYTLYRLLISLILFSLLFFNLRYLGLRYHFFLYYQGTVFAYLALNGLTALLVKAGFRPGQRHISFSLFLDILALHLLAYFGAGMDGGLTNLIIVAVAAGNILAPGRIGFLYAALATLGTLGLSTWGAWSGYEPADSVVRAGGLGILYFAAAFALQNITRRLMRSEALANQRAQSIIELEKLNHQIIQRMRTGIVVSDHLGRIRMANMAACELLTGEQLDPSRLRHLPAPLMTRLEQWLTHPERRSEPFRTSGTAPLIQANFTELDRERGQLVLIFLEDTSKIAQQAQQMKLASLGRLTAGIAHEIRNPLGAISHAAQLMAESESLADSDRRMSDIIQRHSNRVNTIIENVLRLSRRKPTEVSLMDVNEWLTGFLAEFREGQREPSDISLTQSSAPAYARFDRSQLEQVLTNLCENGLRYSEKQTGKRSLELRVGVTGDQERSYIDVQDQGPGVSGEQRTSVFEPFFTTEASGTGLGLYLARELCEANQAQLSLVDNNQTGCCFRITFSPHRRLSQVEWTQ